MGICVGVCIGLDVGQREHAITVLVHHNLLSCIYTRAKAIVFFDLCRCSINTQIESNATDWKQCRFRSNINAPLNYIFLYLQE